MEKSEEQLEGEFQMAYDDQREHGRHNAKYGINCKCFDCLEEKRNQDKILTKKPF